MIIPPERMMKMDANDLRGWLSCLQDQRGEDLLLMQELKEREAAAIAAQRAMERKYVTTAAKSTERFEGLLAKMVEVKDTIEANERELERKLEEQKKKVAACNETIWTHEETVAALEVK